MRWAYFTELLPCTRPVRSNCTVCKEFRRSRGREREFLQLTVKRPGGNPKRLGSFGFISMGLAKGFFDNASFSLLNVPNGARTDLFTMAGCVVLQVHR